MATSPNPIDVHVGKRLRLRRTLLGMSQERLGELLGLTFQQVQKYERGANRIGSSRLFELGQILDVPVSFFFDDMPRGAPGAGQAPAGFGHGGQAYGAPGLAEQAAPFEHDLDDGLSLDKRETLELIRAYYRIADPAVRKRLFELTKALGNLPAGAAPPDR
ncbi:MAG TPA: helix-turn-helix transcriptional regulator [Geminicoccaceae bacterium]|nr:helix-turn-helix transcriptional regulator [Geminicoccaceae bacterium]